ncbi:hypothetical protein IXO1088_012560 [Xanthomonas oryzae pv. oryzae]|nr:hypothetical protein IXO1088_012560 [Xanthomonas oryzae pv. oryzae]
MTWATPFGSEVAQVRSPGSLHNRWCCDPELKPPRRCWASCSFRQTFRNGRGNCRHSASLPPAT